MGDPMNNGEHGALVIVIRLVAAVAWLVSIGSGIAAANHMSVARHFAASDALDRAVEAQASGGWYLSLTLVGAVLLVTALWADRVAVSGHRAEGSRTSG